MYHSISDRDAQALNCLKKTSEILSPILFLTARNQTPKLTTSPFQQKQMAMEVITDYVGNKGPMKSGA